MNTRAIVVTAVAVTVAATAVAVVLHAQTAGSPVADGVTDWWLTGVTMGAVYTLTGGAVLWRRPKLPVGGVLLSVGLAAALGMAALEYGVLGIVEGLGAGAASAFWVGNWLWAVAMVVVVAVLPHLLPNGRGPSGRRRGPLVVGLVSTVAVAILWMTTPYDVISPAVATRAHNPIGIEPGPFAGVLLVVVLLGPVVAVGSVGLR
jgi:hypothetical protein